MYSAAVISRNIARVEARINAQREREGQRGEIQPKKFKLVHFDPATIQEMDERLQSLVNQQSVTDRGAFKWVRDLESYEQAYIDNQIALCQLDFRYACENYFKIQLASESDAPAGWDDLEGETDDEGKAGGRIGLFLLNGMQIKLLEKLARLEELCYEALARGAPVNGILLILHKARQLGASIFFQALGFHRINFYSHINGLTASIDDSSTQALFRRFERMWKSMPIWMRAKIERQERGTGWQMANDSVMDLQSGKQDKDLGKGETWHFAHITEAAVFERPEDHFDEGLFPTIPNSLYSLYGMESTSKGKRGWWYDFVMSVMKGTAEDDSGAGRFSHFFAPFYLIDISDESRGQRSKYRIEAPVDWMPSGNTQLIARRVSDSSEEVCGIPHVLLHRDVLYWYERTRNAYYKRGKLNVFLQNFPLDPHESFQHSSAGAFSSETIEKLENNCADYRPWPYTICGSDEVEQRRQLVDDKRRIYTVGQHHLAPMAEDELDRDPRGIIWLWEQADERHFYSLGSDPTGGIPGWRRAFRTQNDINTDNGTVEVFRKGKPPVACEKCSGKGWLPTTSKGILVECMPCKGRGRMGGQATHVAEFAAPIDAEELALYVYVLGRVFRGNSELDECLAVVESNNTGILTIRKLQSVYEYTNLYQHESIDNAQSPRYTGGIGFVSSATSVPILHAWSRSVVMRRDIDIRSPYLVREMSDAIVKITGTSGESPEELARAKTNAIIVRERFVVPAGGGRHDDRMTGSFLSWWGLFDRRETDPIDVGEFDRRPSKQLPDFARRDATSGEQQAAWNNAVEEYLSDQDLTFDGHQPDCDPSCTATYHIEDDFEEVDESDPSLEYDPAFD